MVKIKLNGTILEAYQKESVLVQDNKLIDNNDGTVSIDMSSHYEEQYVCIFQANIKDILPQLKELLK